MVWRTGQSGGDKRSGVGADNDDRAKIKITVFIVAVSQGFAWVANKAPSLNAAGGSSWKES